MTKSTYVQIKKMLLKMRKELTQGIEESVKEEKDDERSDVGDVYDIASSERDRELSLLLGEAALVIGGDTGPVHLAASFGVPTVAVFLATDWRRNGPLGARTAVVKGAREIAGPPRGSADATPKHHVGSTEIVAAARTLVDV